MNSPEAPFLIVGTCFSAIVGAAQPIFAVIFANIIGLFSQNLPEDEFMNEISNYAIAFVLLGVVNFVGNIGAISCFGKSGEELTRRIRSHAFSKYLELGKD
jgi:ABC-type multidrug transport system fused ATPase/permease subunit